jgi:hypothetical protein
MAKKVSTEVVKVGDPTTDIRTMGVKDVPAMLEAVNKQIAAIKGNMPDKTKTTVALTGFGKIDEINTVESLIKAASTVMAKEKAYNEAAAVVMFEGMKVPAFTINGADSASWLSDIKYRVGIVANQEKLTKLMQIQKTLESNLSAKAKLAKDLADIQMMIEDED